MKKSVSEQLREMNEFVNSNLVECCEEILQWKHTSILKDGKTKDATNFLTDKCFESRQLVHVENAIKDAAMAHVINNR